MPKPAKPKPSPKSSPRSSWRKQPAVPVVTVPCKRCGRELLSPYSAGVPGWGWMTVAFGVVWGFWHCEVCYGRAVKEPKDPENFFGHRQTWE